MQLRALFQSAPLQDGFFGETMTVRSTPDPTHCDFSFVSDATVRSVLEDYFAQAVAAYQAGSFLGAVVGCGAVAEGLLTWLLINREIPARAGSSNAALTCHHLHLFSFAVQFRTTVMGGVPVCFTCVSIKKCCPSLLTS